MFFFIRIFFSLFLFRFFRKATHRERRALQIVVVEEYTGERVFVKKAKRRALVVLKGTETFAAIKKRSIRQRKASSERNSVYIYTHTHTHVILLRVLEFVKDERGGPETLGSDEQGKSPRLLFV